MKLTIMSLPPSTNQLERMHWAVKKRLRRSVAQELTAAIHDQDEPFVPATTRRRVTIRVYRPRRFDPDNAIGGLKVLLDAMRDVGLLKNDSPKWLDLGLDQRIEKTDCRTEILVEKF